MIFISYRREDTDAVVTNLHGRLVERFGEEHVFVDFKDVPPGKIWPEELRKKLEESCVLLAVIGSKWGDARFATGKKKGRLRLDDPEDWVRQEICTAIRRGKAMRVFVIPIDDAKLPETEWDCELDQLSTIQQTPIHNQRYFEQDVLRVCESLEVQFPELNRVSEARRRGVVLSAPIPANPSDLVLRHYLIAELRNHASIQLPLVSPNGQPAIAPIDQLRIDLPLVVSHEHAPSNPQTAFLWIGHAVLFIHEEFRSTHTNALLVDRASRHEDIRRDCDIGQRLGRGSRMVVVGDPGCGKSTLIQWIAHHYASRCAAGGSPANGCVELAHPLPVHDWLPIVILCRDLAGQPLPVQVGDLLRLHLKSRQFSDVMIADLVPHFERLLEQGRAILLIDGLDEIPHSERRVEFCKLLTSIANRFADSAIVVTSRVVGFQAVRDEMAARFDHLLVGPLDRTAKRAFIERWARFIGWNADNAASLVQQVCHSRVTAKLTENIFLLAMVAQIRVLDRELPGRRVDVYRRAVQLMIQRRRPFTGPPLSMNELIPHLEFLAYRMRKRGLQRSSETAVVEAFRELRRLEPDEPILQTRPPEDLLRACIDSLGLLNVAGTETDRRGFDRLVIQFFHQSFQEYFAGQAINHGHDAAGSEGAVARLRDLLATIEIREREVNLWGEYKIVETVLADYWQEAVRMGIADLKPDEADDAILMLLPGPTTPAKEARPRAVFALQCLADEPQVSDETIAAVFDAVIDGFEDGDGYGTKQHTWMDEALAATAESAFGGRLRDRLLEGFIHSSGDQRNSIGGCLTLVLAEANSMVTTQNAEAMIGVAIRELSSDQQAVRIRRALILMYRFYNTNGKLSFLTASQQAILVGALVSALSSDEATADAAMWALLLLTGANYRPPGSPAADSSKPKPVAEFVQIDPANVRRIEEFLQTPGLDNLTLSSGCLVLTREKDLELVVHQLHWLYELAVVADGANPRRLLPLPGPTGRLAPTEWMIDLLKRQRQVERSRWIALALGAFGVYVPEMIQPLRVLFTSSKYAGDERDEALVYLGLIGTAEVAPILVAAADTPPVANDEYLYSRGLFGLLLLDDVDVLAAQIRKALSHSDLNAYAYGLAGSRDPRGRVLLEEMEDHPDERIRTAVAKAFARPWMSDAE